MNVRALTPALLAVRDTFLQGDAGLSVFIHPRHTPSTVRLKPQSLSVVFSYKTIEDLSIETVMGSKTLKLGFLPKAYHAPMVQLAQSIDVDLTLKITPEAAFLVVVKEKFSAYAHAFDQTPLSAGPQRQILDSIDIKAFALETYALSQTPTHHQQLQWHTWSEQPYPDVAGSCYITHQPGVLTWWKKDTLDQTWKATGFRLYTV